MRNTMFYKGYTGSVEFSEEDNLFFGQVLNIQSLISYEGKDAEDLLRDFHVAIDDYLIFCEQEGREPEKPYKGSFNVRFKDPDLHRRAATYAINHNMTLNSFVEQSVAEALAARAVV